MSVQSQPVITQSRTASPARQALIGPLAAPQAPGVLAVVPRPPGPSVDAWDAPLLAVMREALESLRGDWAEMLTAPGTEPDLVGLASVKLGLIEEAIGKIRVAARHAR